MSFQIKFSWGFGSLRTLLFYVNLRRTVIILRSLFIIKMNQVKIEKINGKYKFIHLIYPYVVDIKKYFQFSFNVWSVMY